LFFFSDHGFHLGEKEHWAKRTIWHDGAEVPLIVAGPGVASGVTCEKPVQLLDIYPTLFRLGHLSGVLDRKTENISLRMKALTYSVLFKFW